MRDGVKVNKLNHAQSYLTAVTLFPLSQTAKSRKKTSPTGFIVQAFKKRMNSSDKKRRRMPIEKDF